jgi:hypothetical protein
VVHREGRQVQKLGALARQRFQKSEEEDDVDKFHVPVDGSSGSQISKPFMLNGLQLFEICNFVLFWR